MKTFYFKEATYTVSGLQELSMSDAIRIWKTKHPSYEHFYRDVIKTPYLADLGEFVKEVWDDISPISVQEALEEKNAEIRRVYFQCIGVVNIFKELNPTLLDKQTINKKRTRWDDKGDPYEYVFEDVYELYSIPYEKLIELPFWTVRTNQNPIITAVRCWCTTTNKEYWIYVPEESCMNDKGKFDAVSAIAWTIQIDIKNPEKIYRQGDIIVVKEGPESSKDTPYHLTKEQYLNLMYSES
jgi:hypothetical protein